MFHLSKQILENAYMTAPYNMCTIYLNGKGKQDMGKSAVSYS